VASANLGCVVVKYNLYTSSRKSNVTREATYLPMKMEQTECSEMSAYKIQTPGNYPKENIQHNLPYSPLKY
jgi:hypothetical protein